MLRMKVISAREDKIGKERRKYWGKGFSSRQDSHRTGH